MPMDSRLDQLIDLNWGYRFYSEFNVKPLTSLNNNWGERHGISHILEGVLWHFMWRIDFIDSD